MTSVLFSTLLSHVLPSDVHDTSSSRSPRTSIVNSHSPFIYTDDEYLMVPACMFCPTHRHPECYVCRLLLTDENFPSNLFQSLSSYRARMHARTHACNLPYDGIGGEVVGLFQTSPRQSSAADANVCSQSSPMDDMILIAEAAGGWEMTDRGQRRSSPRPMAVSNVAPPSTLGGMRSARSRRHVQQQQQQQQPTHRVLRVAVARASICTDSMLIEQ